MTRHLPARILLVAATATSLATALLSVRTSALADDMVVLLSVVASALAVFALPSVGSSMAAKLIALGGAYVMGIHGELTALTPVDSVAVVLWLAATVVVLVFPRVDGVGTRSLRPGLAAATVPMALCLFAAGALGASVFTAGVDPAPAREDAQDDPEGDAGPNDPLRTSPTVDMTNRPRLSERPVFTVRTDLATFWRTNVFDRWNGWEWSRTNFAVADAGRGVLDVPGRELPAGSSRVVTQDFELLVNAQALPASPTVTRLEVASPTVLIGGTDLASLQSVGPGTRYSVESVVPTATEDELRAARNTAIPVDVAAAYLDTGPVGTRTAALAESFRSGPTEPWSLVEEMTDWLSANTEYSLDSPTSPPGSDVVENFLFESRLGWCEQIASSLVVLLRANGVPARLAVGYVPGERTPLGDRWLARERDAHAWTELWIQGVGWVPVDPTASVGLAGAVPGQGRSVLEWAGLVALALASFRAVGWAVAALRRRVAAVRSRRPPAGSATSLALGERRLAEIGRRYGAERAASQSISAFSAAVAARSGLVEVAEVGVALDEWRYRWGDAGAVPEEQVAEVLARLDELDRLTTV